MDDNVGYKDGTGGIHKTQNGGGVWSPQYTPSLGIATLVRFFDASFGLGTNTTTTEVVYTTSGGSSWKAVKPGGEDKFAVGFAFGSATTAYGLFKTVTSKSEIWRTTTGGSSWTQDTLPAGLENGDVLSCSAWPSANVQYAGFGSGKKILRVGSPVIGGDAGADASSGGAGGSGGASSGGASGSSGASGSGTGGNAGSATGGSTSIGGSSAGGSGGSTSTGGKNGSSGSSDDGGCGCRVDSRSNASAVWAVVGAALLASRRRRHART